MLRTLRRERDPSAFNRHCPAGNTRYLNPLLHWPVPSSPASGDWCLLPGPARRAISPLPLAQAFCVNKAASVAGRAARAGPGLGWPRLRCTVNESPPLPPPHRTLHPASYTHRNTAAPFCVCGEPKTRQKSGKFSLSRHAAHSISAAANWLTLPVRHRALRASCRSGTNGCGDTRHKKRKERRSARIKASPGIEFLSAQQAQRGETQPGLWCERFPQQLRAFRGYSGAHPAPTDCHLPHRHFQLSLHQPGAGHVEMPLLGS